jgi:hypothetical protein
LGESDHSNPFKFSLFLYHELLQEWGVRVILKSPERVNKYRSFLPK